MSLQICRARLRWKSPVRQLGYIRSAPKDRFVLARDRPAEHEMAHTGRCAGAKTDVRKCRCSCGGLLHGGADGTPAFAGTSPSWSIGSIIAPDEGSAPIISEPSEVARSPIDEALSEIADWLAKNPSVKEQVEAIADIVGEQAVKVLTEYGSR
jgi:hypothetical protein